MGDRRAPDDLYDARYVRAFDEMAGTYERVNELTSFGFAALATPGGGASRADARQRDRCDDRHGRGPGGTFVGTSGRAAGPSRSTCRRGARHAEARRRPRWPAGAIEVSRGRRQQRAAGRLGQEAVLACSAQVALARPAARVRGQIASAAAAEWSAGISSSRCVYATRGRPRWPYLLYPESIQSVPIRGSLAAGQPRELPDAAGCVGALRRRLPEHGRRWRQPDLRAGADQLLFGSTTGAVIAARNAETSARTEPARQVTKVQLRAWR